MTLHHEAVISNYLPMVHRDEEQQQPNYGNHDAERSLSCRHTMNRRSVIGSIGNMSERRAIVARADRDIP